MSKVLGTQGLVVEVDRKLAIGGIWSISPSEGMMGIEDGTVVIVDILHYEDVQDREDVQQFVELGAAFEEDWWVTYRYIHDTDLVDSTTIMCMPADVFAEHISTF